MDKRQGDPENQFPKRGELASIGLIGNARASQIRYMEQEAIRDAKTTVSSQPKFVNIRVKLEKLVEISRDLERRSNEASAHIFGPVPEDNEDAMKMREPEGMIQAFEDLLDQTFYRLNTVQSNLNRLHHELGRNEN